VFQVSRLTTEELQQRTSETYSYPVAYYDHSCYVEQQAERKTEQESSQSLLFYCRLHAFRIFALKTIETTTTTTKITTTRLERLCSVMQYTNSPTTFIQIYYACLSPDQKQHFNEKSFS
jgi:hypothetical protein